MSFFDVGKGAQQLKPSETILEEGLGSFGCQAAPPVRPGDVIAEIMAGLIRRHIDAASSDIAQFGFQDSGPKAEGFVRAAEVAVAEAALGFFDWPRASADVAANVGIGVHFDEIGFVLQFMGAEEEAVRLEINHRQCRVRQAARRKQATRRDPPRGRKFASERRSKKRTRKCRKALIERSFAYNGKFTGEL